MSPPPPIVLPNLPPGWSRGNVPSPVVKRAREVLSMQLSYGQGVVDTIDGVTYAFRNEPHYDDHVGGVLQWHPGISVWTKTDPNAADPLGLTIVAPLAMKASTGSSGSQRLAALALFAIGIGLGFVGASGGGRRA